MHAMDPITLNSVTGIAHSIQLAVAPVFLLTGIGALLGVLTNRLGRIVDRGRALEARLPTTAESDREPLIRELDRLGERKWLANGAITLCTVCALFVCAVVATLFVGAFITAEVDVVVASLFISAMVSLIVALLFFLREIYVSINKTRVPRRRHRTGEL